MNRSFCVSVVGLAVSGAGSNGQTPSDPYCASCSLDSQRNHEPAIVASPGSPNRVLVTWAYDSATMRWALSTNWGSTFPYGGDMPLPSGCNGGFDQAVAASYVNARMWAGGNTNLSGSKVFYATIDPTATAPASPVVVPAASGQLPLDKPFMAAGPVPGTGSDESLHVVATKPFDISLHTVSTGSPPPGSGFPSSMNSINASGFPLGFGIFPVVLRHPDVKGRIVVAGGAITGVPKANFSDDLGASWQAQFRTFPTDNNGDDIQSVGSALATPPGIVPLGLSSVATDPNDTRIVYVAFAGRSGPPSNPSARTDIFIAVSLNGGGSFLQANLSITSPILNYASRAKPQRPTRSSRPSPSTKGAGST